MKSNRSNMKRNESTIAGAFARARENHFDSIRDTLCNLLDSSMKKCIALHDEQHPEHIKNPDDYGWVLWYNGAVAGCSESKGADTILKDVSDVPTRGGWFGAVVANMRMKYLDWDYEVDIMHQVVPELESTLKELFELK